MRIKNRSNESSSNDWKRYSGHREMVTNMLIECLGLVENKPDKTLGVWGAGKCNDVDLNQLLTVFSSINLVDILQEDLALAIASQNCDRDPRIKLHGNCDLSGIDPLLSRYAKTPKRDLLAQTKHDARSFAGPNLEHSDVVVSNAMLTQLIDSIVNRVGEDDPEFSEIVLAIRNRHLDLIVEYTNPGGVAFLVTDVVSSFTNPKLLEPIEDLTALVRQSIAESNFFHGVNPAAILQYYQKQSPTRGRIKSVKPSEPWIWDGPGNYLRAVVAIRLEIKKLP